MEMLSKWLSPGTKKFYWETEEGNGDKIRKLREQGRHHEVFRWQHKSSKLLESKEEAESLQARKKIEHVEIFIRVSSASSLPGDQSQLRGSILQLYHYSNHPIVESLWEI